MYLSLQCLYIDIWLQYIFCGVSTECQKLRTEDAFHLVATTKPIGSSKLQTLGLQPHLTSKLNMEVPPLVVFLNNIMDFIFTWIL